MLGPIQNAKDVLLTDNPGTLPNMQEALTDWFQQIKAIRIIKVQVNYQTVERGDPIYFQGVIQPFKAKELQMKPEGQRSWKWFWLHCYATVMFDTDDVFYIGTTRYRVMATNDYAVYGYMEYQLIQDYQDGRSAPPVPDGETLIPPWSDLNDKHFLQDIIFTDPLIQAVSVTGNGGLDNALEAEWLLFLVNEDGSVTPYTTAGAIVVDSIMQVTITVTAPGTYRLTGVQ